MFFRRFPILGMVLLASCSTNNVDKRTDNLVSDVARRAFDRAPPEATASDTGPAAKTSSTSSVDPTQAKKDAKPSFKDVKTAGYLELAPDDPKDQKKEQTFKFEIPAGVPGQEVPKLKGETKEQVLEEVRKLYVPLPPLPEEPKAVPGPEGKPFMLADLQDIAARNSPTLKQAASDVLAAEGAVIQAKTYQNPNLAYTYEPANNGETASVWGLLLDQKINTAGKMKLQVAAAEKSLDNAKLALKKARSDLATAVRQAYFGLLVARESVRVNYAVSQLTDEVYMAQANMLMKGGIAAAYEPSGLRSQAYAARLALRQSINNYHFAWKQIVVTIGLRQLPLTEVAGRVDAFIPYFDYDAVFAHVAQNHTDILTARNSIEQSRYNLKFAQVTPFSDIDFQLNVSKETSLQPFQWQMIGQVGITLPVWDRNRGNIMSAEASLIRASEQVHASEINLANNLQNAFNTYKNNLDGLEYYRKFILPDQVLFYRGVLARRYVDPTANFSDLFTAQQALAGNVTTYLTILSQLWTSAIQVADFLQTDDLYELAKPYAVPPVPDMSHLPPLPCCHPNAAPGGMQPDQPMCTAPTTTLVPGRDVPPMLPTPVPMPLTNPAPIAAPQTKP